MEKGLYMEELRRRYMEWIHDFKIEITNQVLNSPKYNVSYPFYVSSKIEVTNITSYPLHWFC